MLPALQSTGAWCSHVQRFLQSEINKFWTFYQVIWLISYTYAIMYSMRNSQNGVHLFPEVNSTVNHLHLPSRVTSVSRLVKRNGAWPRVWILRTWRLKLFEQWRQKTIKFWDQSSIDPYCTQLTFTGTNDGVVLSKRCASGTSTLASLFAIGTLPLEVKIIQNAWKVYPSSFIVILLP